MSWRHQHRFQLRSAPNSDFLHIASRKTFGCKSNLPLFEDFVHQFWFYNHSPSLKTMHAKMTCNWITNGADTCDATPVGLTCSQAVWSILHRKNVNQAIILNVVRMSGFRNDKKYTFWVIKDSRCFAVNWLLLRFTQFLQIFPKPYK